MNETHYVNASFTQSFGSGNNSNSYDHSYVARDPMILPSVLELYDHPGRMIPYSRGVSPAETSTGDHQEMTAEELTAALDKYNIELSPKQFEEMLKAANTKNKEAVPPEKTSKQQKQKKQKKHGADQRKTTDAKSNDVSPSEKTSEGVEQTNQIATDLVMTNTEHKETSISEATSKPTEKDDANTASLELSDSQSTEHRKEIRSAESTQRAQVLKLLVQRHELALLKRERQEAQETLSLLKEAGVSENELVKIYQEAEKYTKDIAEKEKSLATVKKQKKDIEEKIAELKVDAVVTTQKAENNTEKGLMKLKVGFFVQLDSTASNGAAQELKGQAQREQAQRHTNNADILAKNARDLKKTAQVAKPDEKITVTKPSGKTINLTPDQALKLAEKQTERAETSVVKANKLNAKANANVAVGGAKKAAAIELKKQIDNSAATIGSNIGGNLVRVIKDSDKYESVGDMVLDFGKNTAKDTVKQVGTSVAYESARGAIKQFAGKSGKYIPGLQAISIGSDFFTAISSAESGDEVVENVVVAAIETGGRLASYELGQMIGAAAGSAVPVIGTIGGAIVGGIAGAIIYEVVSFGTGAIKQYLETERTSARAENYYFGRNGLPQDYNQSVIHAMNAANQGNNLARFRLGFCYSRGQGVQLNYLESMFWYLSGQGESTSINNIGIAFENGRGPRQDIDTAIFFYRTAVAKGNQAARQNLQRLAPELNNILIAQEQPNRNPSHHAANHGNASAQFRLGHHYANYANNNGQNRNYHESVYWYTQAGNQGHSTALYNLGVHHANGWGVRQDIHQAIYNYREAYARGYRGENNNSVINAIRRHDPGLAQILENPLRQRNNFGVYNTPEKQRVRAENCYHGINGCQQNFQEAAEWAYHAAVAGDATAQFRIAYCYTNGQGVPQNNHESYYWYSKAANQGHLLARHNVGWSYEYGRGVTQDNFEALLNYRVAAERGCVNSQVRIARAYEHGQLGLAQNQDQAVFWYLRGAAQNNEEAINSLLRLQPNGVANALRIR